MSGLRTAAREALGLIGEVHNLPNAGEPDSPLVLAAADDRNLLSIEEEGVVKSACAVLERTFICSDERLRVGLIGTVSTAPGERGRGRASRLLERAELELRSRGCAIALLWAEDPRFYHARGWRPIGAEDDYLLPPTLASRLPRMDVRTATAADAPRLHELANAHPTRVERSVDEMRALLACRGMQTRVALEGERIVGYTCCGRALDLQGVVHEWGGEPHAVLALLGEELRGISDQRPGLLVIAPADASSLREALGGFDVQPLRGILGLGKVLDRRLLAELLQRRVGTSARVECDAAASTVVLHGAIGGGDLSDDSLLTLLFSERGIRDDIETLGLAFGFDASRLPLSPFAFGLDGI
ncbi:MAG: GNAT family N-acetyltransferase [Planctomycetes bacterium]|nr:GNAT family N-acetyltransferase [Planctomycetota bacterium]